MIPNLPRYSTTGCPLLDVFKTVDWVEMELEMMELIFAV